MITSIKSFCRCAALFAALATVVHSQDATRPTEAANETPAGKHLLRQILIVESVEAAKSFSAPGAGFVALSPALATMDAAELKKRLADGENRAIEPTLLVAIGQVIEAVVRQNGSPNATTIVPTQSVADGVLRIVLLLNPPLIRQILVSEGVEQAQQFASKPGAGFVVLAPSLSFLDGKELGKRLAVGEGKPFQEKLVAAIVQVIEVFLKQNDLPAATAILPPQNASDGTLRVAVQLGKIRSIKVEGNRWFSDSLLREKLRIEKGGILRFSELDRAISWTNNNPFRRVRVKIDPVANTGEADLIIAVQEALPLRGQATYDNGGNVIVGRHRMTASATYGNLWGRDHQISYQLITTDKGFRTYAGQGLDYRVPLPWHDQIQLSASYVKLQPSILEGLLTQKGENLTANLRYSHPVRSGDNSAEVFAGVEFKESNNNLLWWDATGTTSTPVLTNKTDVFQFTAGGSSIFRDKRGAWGLGANVNFSPGGLNSRNSDAAFDSSRTFAKARYLYGQVTFQRLLTLYHGWDFTCRGILQMSPKNLLPSEQLFIGGASTVRGFRENVFGGDKGFLLTNELLSPAVSQKLPFLPNARNVLETRFIGFYDVANVNPHLRSSLDQQLVPLASVGLGLRSNLATNVSVTADYGWQITELPYKTAEKSRGHIRVVLAF